MPISSYVAIVTRWFFLSFCGKKLTNLWDSRFITPSQAVCRLQFLWIFHKIRLYELGTPGNTVKVQLTDFKKPGMPPYRVFMCNYGLTPTEWLQANYPEHYPTTDQLKDLYTKAFIEDYMRLKPKSADDFNERRSDKSRGWRCVARYHHLGTWTNLINYLNLPKYSDEKQKRTPSKVTVVVHNDYDFRD